MVLSLRDLGARKSAARDAAGSFARCGVAALGAVFPGVTAEHLGTQRLKSHLDQV